MVSCNPLGSLAPFASTCFGHAMSKAYEYATDEKKVCNGTKEISLKGYIPSFSTKDNHLDEEVWEGALR